MKHKLPFLCMTVFSLALPACSKEPVTAPDSVEASDVQQSDHEKYLSWHNICLEGDTKKIGQHIELFENVLKKSPKDDLARAYLGSAYALKAKHSFFPPTKLSSLKKGKSLLEAAVKNSPSNPRVRMVRAIAYHKVPKRFGTHPTSISDFEMLLQAIKKKANKLSVNEQQAILYYAHLAFSQSEHTSAAEAKTLCHRIDPHSKYGKLTK